jgi:hypothetical protein
MKAEQGNSKGYTLSRLNRDYPELYDRVIADFSTTGANPP